MDLATNNDKYLKRQSTELSYSTIIILLRKTARALVVSMETPSKLVCACSVVFRAYQKSTFLSTIYRFTETLSIVKRCPLNPNSSQGRLEDYNWRNNIAEIFKVNNTVNNPFSLINITHMLQFLRCPVAPFPPKTLLSLCNALMVATYIFRRQKEFDLVETGNTIRQET